MAAQQPYRIIAAPATVWLAAVGTAFPNVGAAPAAAWIKLGTSGDQDYAEDGVSLKLGQTIERVRTLGSMAPVKAFRTSEELVISLTLLDMTLEQLVKAMNHNTVTDTAAASGVPGYRATPLRRGADVTQRAMLIRGPSGYDAGMDCDWRIPRVVNIGEPEVVYKKDEPIGILMEFEAIEDPDYANGRLGEILMQDAAALP